MRRFIGQIRRTRAAFTLMEVNLAIFIMAVGVLAMTALYPLGFRESQQARDDVRAAIVADEVLGKLTAALSSRNIEWQEWKTAAEKAVRASNDGGIGQAWLSYFKTGNGNAHVAQSRSEMNTHAKGVFDELAKAADGATAKPTWDNFNTKYAHGLVVQWGKRIISGEPVSDYSRVSISFRMSRRAGSLMAAPIYYTEVHFQGDQKDMEQ